MMRRKNGRVEFDLSEDDFMCLLVVLGFAWKAAEAHRNPAFRPEEVLRLANVINKGNPNYTPVEIEPAETVNG
jgi:hypothetical protein